jgi:hypothetical protein
MPNFISTQTVMLISFLGKKMPNLLKYIVQYSTTQTGKDVPPKPTKVLSSQQIQEACQHPNAIIAQTLNTVVAIQGTLNAVETKVKELAKQRSMIESTLVSLLEFNNKKEK